MKEEEEEEEKDDEVEEEEEEEVNRELQTKEVGYKGSRGGPGVGVKEIEVPCSAR